MKKRRFSTIDAMLDAAPETTFGMFFQAMVELAEHYFDDEKQDFAFNGSPDHPFVKWIIVLKWMKMVAMEDEEPPLH